MELEKNKMVSFSIEETLYIMYLACENAENTFVKIHNREIAALVSIDDGVRVQADNKVVTHFGGFLEEIEMTDVE